MEEDIKILEDMRDNIYGAIQFEDDLEVKIHIRKQFDALNLAINHLRKTKLVHSQYISKTEVKELIQDIKDNCDTNDDRVDGQIYILQSLLEE